MLDPTARTQHPVTPLRFRCRDSHASPKPRVHPVTVRTTQPMIERACLTSTNHLPQHGVARASHRSGLRQRATTPSRRRPGHRRPLIRPTSPDRTHPSRGISGTRERSAPVTRGVPPSPADAQRNTQNRAPRADHLQRRPRPPQPPRMISHYPTNPRCAPHQPQPPSNPATQPYPSCEVHPGNCCARVLSTTEGHLRRLADLRIR